MNPHGPASQALRDANALRPVKVWITVGSGSSLAPAEPDMSSSGTFQAGGKWYDVALAPGWQVAYAATPFGILWSPVAPPAEPHGLQNPETAIAAATAAQAGSTPSAAGLYLSPLAGTSTAKHPYSLLAVSRLLIPGPSAPLFDRVSVSLAASASIGLYTVEERSADGTQVAVYAVTASSAQTVRLAGMTLSPDERLSSWPTENGAILAIGRDTPYGWTVGSAYFLSVPQLQKVEIPATLWPLEVNTNPVSHAVTVTSGPQAFTLSKSGTITRGYAEVSSEALTGLKRYMKNAQALVAPLPTYPSSSARWRLTLNGPDSYEWTLPANPGSGLYGWTARVTVATGAAQSGPRQTQTVDTATLYPSFFGPLHPLHAFSLGSQEGPAITWVQAASLAARPANPLPASWFASFAAHGWTYEIGPFTDPANRSETTLLSSLIGRARTLRPSPLGNGTAYIRLDPKSDVYTASMIRFRPASDVRVTVAGSGLDALSAALHLGVWIKSVSAATGGTGG